MRCDMCQFDRHFRIDAGNKMAAFEALKGWEARKIGTNHADADPESLPLGGAETLEEALRVLCWEPGTDEEGNVVDLGFTGEMLCDEKTWLGVLAPYVAGGSYLTMIDEDYYAWCWYFDGETCKEYAGELIFPGCPEYESNDHGEARIRRDNIAEKI